MSASLFSPAWYRVADLVPRLRSHAKIHRLRYRGGIWYVLQDRVSGSYHRFSPAANELIGLMNGHRTLAEIWKLAAERLDDDLPTQDETIRLVSQLYHANALLTDATADVSELMARGDKIRRNRLIQKFKSPLALKIPLVHPDAWLSRVFPWVRPLFTRFGIAVWCAVVVPALLIVAQNWSTLTDGLADRVLAAENLALLWFSFPVVKLLHELGHAFAVKRWGGEVHEMGVMFLVGVPVPYVDASASTAFSFSHRRVFVGAAGVLVELFIAALATFVWVSVEPGVVRALAFNVMIIASVSSLLFNGNPLLRFDAYYVLSDWLEIPNLGARANRYLAYWVQRYAFGGRDVPSPVSAPGEAFWLPAYAIASFIARLAVTLSIAFFVASELFIVGVLLASWSVFQFALLPLAKQLRFLAVDPRLQRNRPRAVFVSGAFASLLAVLVLLVPVPSWTRCEGVVWAPERTQVRAQTSGVISSLYVEAGDRVEENDPLFAMVDPDLVFEEQAAKASLRALEAQYADERIHDRLQAEITREAVAHAQARLERSRERLTALTVLSPRAGRFLVERPGDLPGRFVQRGEVLGYVVDHPPIVVRAAIPASQIDQVRLHTVRIDLRLAERVETVLSGELLAEMPAATDELPSLALSVEGGGEIALGANASEGRAFRKLFLVDLIIRDAAAPVGIGGRVYVRFAHPNETLAVQGYRAVRRLFLSRFNV